MEVKKETHVTGKTGAQRSATKGKGRYDCIWLGFPHMLFRLARLFEQGIESGYAPGNWKKGTDLRRWLEGGCRHLSQFAEGLTNEDHLIAGIWNLLCLGETRHLIETGVLPAELDNLPFTPEPGDTRINPETGLPETYIRVADPPVTEYDPADIIYHDTTQTNHASVCRCIECLKEDVESGGLLSDGENDRLLQAEARGKQTPPFSVDPASPEGDETVIGVMQEGLEALHEGKPLVTREVNYKDTTGIDAIAETAIEMVRKHSKEVIEPPTFYVCGPMTGIEKFNFPLFDQVTELARSQGLSVISPAELDREHGIDPSVDPDSVERARRADPNLIQTIVQRDTQVIVGLERDKGDGLILLPCWQHSTGGRAEIALALWMGLSFKQVRTTWYGQDCEPEIADVSIEWIKSSLFCQARV